MNGDRCGEKQLPPILRYYPGICLSEIMKTTKPSVSIASPWVGFKLSISSVQVT